MKWSQLKRRIEDMLAEPLRGRVHFFATRYRHAHDSEGRGWITIDGIEICDMSTLRAFAEQHRLAARATGRDEKTAWDDWGQSARHHS